ncbi:hypothetical protein CYMTET_14329 [Cymbomonas tetramitiformis]|uniref:Sulfotransferase n=1 Tax=Cymbomonas tetramitiformis TaxID=36881 RepID=A0AAE0GGQ4_9CHLO|nr:hypothetical protein CYMTET_14329 [Cymbomonas tetramitiformis]
MNVTILKCILIGCVLHFDVTTARSICFDGTTKFVIVSSQRSGTRWLVSLLNSHPDVAVGGELFSHSHGTLDWEQILKTLQTYYFDCSERKNWKSLKSLKGANATTVGFKWMYGQGLENNYPLVLKFLQEKEIAVVHLERRDALKQAVSYFSNRFNAETTEHHAHATTEKEAALRRHAIHIDVQALLKRMTAVSESTKRAEEVFSGSGIAYLRLIYEDMTSSEEQKRVELQKLQKFLSLTVRELSSKQVQIHSSNLSESILNYGEIAEGLRGTSFAEFLMPAETAAASRRPQTVQGISSEALGIPKTLKPHTLDQMQLKIARKAKLVAGLPKHSISQTWAGRTSKAKAKKKSVAKYKADVTKKKKTSMGEVKG